MLLSADSALKQHCASPKICEQCWKSIFLSAKEISVENCQVIWNSAVQRWQVQICGSGLFSTDLLCDFISEDLKVSIKVLIAVHLTLYNDVFFEVSRSERGAFNFELRKLFYENFLQTGSIPVSLLVYFSHDYLSNFWKFSNFSEFS